MTVKMKGIESVRELTTADLLKVHSDMDTYDVESGPENSVSLEIIRRATGCDFDDEILKGTTSDFIDVCEHLLEYKAKAETLKTEWHCTETALMFADDFLTDDLEYLLAENSEYFGLYPTYSMYELDDFLPQNPSDAFIEGKYSYSYPYPNSEFNYTDDYFLIDGYGHYASLSDHQRTKMCLNGLWVSLNDLIDECSEFNRYELADALGFVFLFDESLPEEGVKALAEKCKEI